MIGDVRSRCILGDVVIGRIAGRKEVDPYEGRYTVTPSADSQILETENKKMLNNVIVKAIPYHSEPYKYGTAIYIGSES